MAAYERVLKTTLDRPSLLIAGSLVIVLASYGGYQLLGTGLLPEMDEGGFILDYIMPAGSSLAETNRVITAVEEMLRKTPEVEARRGAPACSSGWRPSPRRTSATSR